MFTQRRVRALGVVGDARLEDLLVLAAAGGELPALGRFEAVTLAGLPHRLDQPQQPRGLGGLVEREVKLLVGRRGGRRGVVRHPVQGRQAGARPCLIGGGETLGGAADRGQLEREPRLEHLAQIGDRQLRHAGAAVRDVLDQAGRVEPAKRLADRHRAHPQQLRELLDREPRARPQATGDDRRVERLERLLGERPVPLDAAVERRDRQAERAHGLRTGWCGRLHDAQRYRVIAVCELPASVRPGCRRRRAPASGR